MLSNVKLKTDNPNFPELIFDFDGGSMTDFSNEEKAEKSISPNNRLGGTSVYAEKYNSVEKVSKEIDIEGRYFVVVPFFEEPFVCSVKDVRNGWAKFSFHSNHKEWFPDQVLRLDEIKSIHAVTRIVYNMVMPGGCHCAVDGDYCGDECNYPENNPELKEGHQVG